LVRRENRTTLCLFIKLQMKIVRRASFNLPTYPSTPVKKLIIGRLPLHIKSSD
jgi:hypothetical protein